MGEGKIAKVSGPLVVAEGLENAKMYDLVRVGKERLMGEIIELRGNTASIQVYEETVGIGPGDPVEDTGEPLSVELGPGLLQSIYDGVERPLEVLKDQVGNFIHRGLEAPGISREKKWPFKPTVSKGDKVVPGDILGTVQETTIIEHKIMVPPGIEGTIVDIDSGGFTVEETVAVVKSDDGKEHKVSMLQRWPVRKARPYQEKLAPDAPLITGQRVVDTFFPIAQGGTACVPGPFGSGKCVTGDTPVLMTDGEIVSIKQIFESYKDKGKVVKNGNEQYTLLDQPFEVFAFDNGKMAKSEVTSVYKGKTDKILEIRTKSGRIGKVTPIHKLFKVEGDLSILCTEAQHLKVGDSLAAPRFLNLPGRIQGIPIADIFDENRLADEAILITIPEIINELTEKYGNKKKVASKLNTSYEVLIEYYLGRNKPTIGFVRGLYKEAGRKVPIIKLIKGERQSKTVKIPVNFDARFAAFLGLILGDGQIKKNSIRFYNNDEQVLGLFESLAQELFGLSVKRTVVNTVKCSLIESSILAKLVKYFGYPEYKKSRNCFVPPIVLQSPRTILGAFLNAYFICDGYFFSKKGEIEISSASKKLQTSLSYLLLYLGIMNRVTSRTSNGFKHYRLFISNRAEIEKFYKCCPLFLKDNRKVQDIEAYLQENRRGFTGVDIVPLDAQYLDEIYTKVGRPYAKLKANGVEIHNYLSGETMSKEMYQRFAMTLGEEEPSLIKFATNHLEHIYCDKIVEIKEIDECIDVYDIEVPEGHNYIGGHAPMFLHNTVIQHQFARWSDAQIIIFIGCGERGNEMTEVLIDFPELIDPYSGEPLMMRTVLIANTSNMPVAAREASVYTGITIAEYYRDMGYSVALQADSTSRWAEAMREISGRLEEMPGEEGFPAYLGSRIASFYERAGKVKCLGSDNREGAVTVVGSVSPPGGDLSEPVVQNTLRVVKVFWGLVDWLAYQRHFPAIDWLISYSLYLDKIKEYWRKEVNPEFEELHDEAMAILQRESELKEIARLVGIEALSTNERLIMEAAKSVREDFLQQHAFHPDDTFTSLNKQYLLLKLVLTFHHQATEAMKQGKELKDVLSAPVREEIAKAKYTPEEELDKFNEIEKRIAEQLKASSIVSGAAGEAQVSGGGG